jgi:hypothetical protein
LKTGSGKKYYSDVINIEERKHDFQLLTVLNPFNSHIQLELNNSQDRKVELFLMNASGHTLRQQNLILSQGVTNLTVSQLEDLPKGVYILKLKDKENTITRKLIKQ